jgi:hypothetical protein
MLFSPLIHPKRAFLPAKIEHRSVDGPRDGGRLGDQSDEQKLGCWIHNKILNEKVAEAGQPAAEDNGQDDGQRFENALGGLEWTMLLLGLGLLHFVSPFMAWNSFI